MRQENLSVCLLRLAYLMLVLLLPSAASAETEDVASAWRRLAAADVEAMHSTIVAVHPLMVDPETQDFPARVEAAYRIAMERANAARDFADWRIATQGFIESFRDGHVIFRLEAVPSRVRWPGFLVEGRESGYLAHRPQSLAGGTAAIPDGARLIGCDGASIEDQIISRLDGIEADMTKKPERLRQAYRYLLDYRMEGPGPVLSCRIVTADGMTDVTLEWQAIAWAQLAPRLGAVNREVERPIGARKLTSGVRWVELGSFGDPSLLEPLVAELEADTGSLRSAPAIVIDLRGNRGGSSHWGYRLAAAIWGEAAVGHRLANAEGRAVRAGLGKFWRATPEAAALVRASAARFATSGDHDAAAYFGSVADLIDRAREDKQSLADDPCCRNWRSPRALVTGDPPSPAYSGKVLLLTDAGCFSSCISAIVPFDLMGARRIGETTGQNGEGGEVVGPLITPSGLARYFVPASIIRAGGAAQAVYPVDLPWDASMNDTAGLEKWVEEMVLPSVPKSLDLQQ